MITSDRLKDDEIERLRRQGKEADDLLIASETAREKLRTEVEFCRRQLTDPGKWKPEELIAWAAEKLAAAMKIEPIQ